MGIKSLYGRRENRTATICGRQFAVDVVKIPFREGVELHLQLEQEQIRVSDRGLGEREAWRLLEEEVERRIGLVKLKKEGS